MDPAVRLMLLGVQLLALPLESAVRTVVFRNGDWTEVTTVPVLVIVKAFVLLSTMVAFCRVSRDVLVTAVSAAVGGMKLAV